jgi:large subunit ribosomal protein L21
MYAIVKVGGKQYRVEKGDSVVVDRMPADEGASVALEPLLLAGDAKDKTVFERDELAKVKVEAVVSGHERGKKIHVLKYKPKKGYRRRSGHRSDLTRLEIKDIKLMSRKPAAKKDEAPAKAEAAEAKPAKAEAAVAKPAPKRAPAKKTPAKKAPARKKPAAKKEESEDGS